MDNGLDRFGIVLLKPITFTPKDILIIQKKTFLVEEVTHETPCKIPSLPTILPHTLLANSDIQLLPN